MITLFKVLSFIMLFLSFTINAKDTITLWDENYKNESNLAFIQLAADLTVDEYGEYEIIPSAPFEQGRAFASLNNPKQINVMIASVDSKREQEANAIYVPLERGLAGFRVCLIKNENKDTFANINTLRDFRKRQLYIGVGAHWPDKDILDFNRLPVTTSPITNDLYSMLEVGRFECFSRSIKEISGNLASHNQTDISVEQHIAFIYPLADFIYVSKRETKLTERLKKGLKLAIENGQYYTLFDRYYKGSLLEHNLYGRKLFFLKNKNMSAKAREAINQYGIASFSRNY